MRQQLRFGRFEVKPDERVLLIDGRPAKLSARGFDLLLVLMQRRDRLVTKDELLRLVWRGREVGESNLHAQVSTLRAILGPLAIATIAGRGYQFIANVEDAPNEAAFGGESSKAERTPEATRASDGPHSASASNVLPGSQADSGTSRLADWSHATDYRFGECELQPTKRRLLVDGKPAVVGARAFDLLLALIQRRERIVSKNELLDLVWSDVIVEENNLPTQISGLRRVIGPQAIRTVPGRGYQFVQALMVQTRPSRPPAPLSATSARTAHDIADVPRAQEAALTFKTNLRSTLTPLFGRESDVAALNAMLSQHRFVTVLGAGGVGKTLLAQHVLQGRCGAYRHAVCWVDLASIGDASLLCGSIGAALGLQLGSGDPRERLKSALAPLSVLVALDNAEHLLAEVSDLAGDLHDSAPGLSLLVTSQTPLRLSAEHVYRLEGLAVPQQAVAALDAMDSGAVALFVARAQAANARFELTDANVSAVIELCRALDGLPLAIELAAARAPTLGVQRLVSSLADRLRLLTASNDRSAPARQQTLRAALEWSHSLLGAHEQVVFRRLGVMAGSASLELVQQVAADPEGEGALDEWSVVEALAHLVDRSLVVVLSDDSMAADEFPRYQLLQSPGIFAMERLLESGEHEAIRQRHASAVARLLDAAWDVGYSGQIGVVDWMHKLSFDLDNARAALSKAVEAGAASEGLAIASTLLRALPMALHAERMALAEQCHALIVERAPLRLRQRAWTQLSAVWANTQKQRSHDAAHRAVALARQLHAEGGDPFDLYLALCRLAFTAASAREVNTAKTALTELRLLEDSAWPAQRLHARVAAEAHIAGLLGTAVEALEHTRHQVAVDHHRGADTISGGKVNLIHFELAVGDPGAAARTGSALVAALEVSRDEHRLAYARLNLTAAWLALGDCARARDVASKGWPQAARFDMQPFWADYLALLAARESRPRAAAKLLAYADAAYPIGDGREPNEAEAYERARRLASESLGGAEYDRLREQGATLSDSEIAELAFGLHDC